MLTKFDEKEETLFLALMAKNIWRARREGALVGFIYSFLIGVLLWVAVASLGPFAAPSAVIYAACGTLVFDL